MLSQDRELGVGYAWQSGFVLLGGDAQLTLDNPDTHDFASDGNGAKLPGFAVTNALAEYAARATYGQEFVGEVMPPNDPGRVFRVSAGLRF